MGTINDLRGRTFGRLTVPKRAEPEMRSSKLVIGRIVSCGCWRADPNIRQAARTKVPAKRRSEDRAHGRGGAH